MQMASWLRLPRVPRIFSGAISATYMGTRFDAAPMPSPHSTRPESRGRRRDICCRIICCGERRVSAAHRVASPRVASLVRESKRALESYDWGIIAVTWKVAPRGSCYVPPDSG